MTTKEVALKTGMGERTIKKYALKGWLAGEKIEGVYHFTHGAIEQAHRIWRRNQREHTAWNKNRPVRSE
jgi:hypothetical protein